MKKIVLIIVLAILSLSLKSQTYDTLVYIPAEIEACPSTFNTDADSILFYSAFTYYGLRRQYCPNNDYDPFYSGYLVGTNSYFPEMFAQPYFMDSTVRVVGAAVQFAGAKQYMTIPHLNLYLQDTGFSAILASTLFMTTYDTTQSQSYILGNFYFDTPVDIKNFVLAAETPLLAPGNYLSRFNHTLSAFDTSSCLGKDVQCYTGHSPYFKKNGVWTKFEDDYVYEIFSKMHIYIFPILTFKRNSSIDEITKSEIQVNVFPNPAKDNINITCSFIIEEVKILDIMGRKVKEEEVKDYSKTINTQNLSKGIYIAKIKTQQGTTTKKFTIE
ncbi:MAG: T9SS type A sorting domain-containing protein [Bacteroidales bacterium]